MQFQVTFYFRSSVSQETRAITATNWQDCYTQAQNIITAEGWTDAVLKTINRIPSDILTRKEKIHRSLSEFPPYKNLDQQDKVDIVNFIDGKLP